MWKYTKFWHYKLYVKNNNGRILVDYACWSSVNLPVSTFFSNIWAHTSLSMLVTELKQFDIYCHCCFWHVILFLPLCKMKPNFVSVILTTYGEYIVTLPCKFPFQYSIFWGGGTRYIQSSLTPPFNLMDFTFKAVYTNCALLHLTKMSYVPFYLYLLNTEHPFHWIGLTRH
jgi:hypothetical protein